MAIRNTFPPIVLAVFSRNVSKIRSLIASGGSVDEVDYRGRTALMHACAAGDLDMVRGLLESGADASRTDRAGWTALHFAAREYRAAVAQVLLDCGAPIDAEDENGNTPLGQAVFFSRGRGEVIALLRRHGADLLHENKHGVSPASLAESIAAYDVRQFTR